MNIRPYEQGLPFEFKKTLVEDILSHDDRDKALAILDLSAV